MANQKYIRIKFNRIKSNYKRTDKNDKNMNKNDIYKLIFIRPIISESKIINAKNCNILQLLN